MAYAATRHLFAWRQAVRDSKLTATEASVARVLSDFGDVDGNNIFPSAERIAHDSKFKVRSVYGALKRLEALGWISVTRRYNERGQTSNLYALTIPRGFVPSPYVVTAPGALTGE